MGNVGEPDYIIEVPRRADRPEAPTVTPEPVTVPEPAPETPEPVLVP